MPRRSATLLLALAIVLPAVSAAGAEAGGDRLARQVRHELVLLPYYSVFDNFTFRLEGGKVTLGGQVSTADSEVGSRAGRQEH